MQPALKERRLKEPGLYIGVLVAGWIACRESRPHSPPTCHYTSPRTPSSILHPTNPDNIILIKNRIDIKIPINAIFTKE